MTSVIYINEEQVPRVYPNPVSDILIVESDAEIESLRIFDIQGRLLSTVSVNTKIFELDFSQFAEGTYLVTVLTATNSYNTLVIKE